MVLGARPSGHILPMLTVQSEENKECQMRFPLILLKYGIKWRESREMLFVLQVIYKYIIVSKTFLVLYFNIF